MRIDLRVVGEGVNTYLLRGILLLKSPGLMAADKPFLKNTDKNLTKILQIVKELNEEIAKNLVFFGT